VLSAYGNGAPCPPGTELTGTPPAAACTPCAAGTFSAAGGTCAACDLTAPCTACEPTTGHCARCTAGRGAAGSEPTGAAAGAVGCTPCATVPAEVSDGTACVLQSLYNDHDHCQAGQECATPPAFPGGGCDANVTCTPCPDGTWSDQNMDTCQPCPVGCDEPGAYCTPTNGRCESGCDAGYTLFGHLCANCSLPGHCQNSGNLCLAGYYSSGVGVCEPCAAATWDNDGDPDTVCESCALVGGVGPGGTNCLECDSISGACTRCAPGYGRNASDAQRCVQCAAGTYSDGERCVPCPPGAAAAAGASACTACGGGTEPGATSCAACDTGEISDGTLCTPCPAGSVPDAASTACVRCAEGTFALVGSATCANCTATNCLHCAGTTDTCLLCRHDYYLTAGTCTPCPADTRCDGTAETAPCPANTTSPVGYSQCFADGSSTSLDLTELQAGCAPGYIWNEPPVPARCTQCAAGTYAPGGITQTCEVCAPGTVSAQGASACTPCAPGTYDNGTNVCASCTADFGAGYTSAEGATACENYQAQIAAVVADTQAHDRCSPGREWSGSACVDCGAGEYSDGVTACAPNTVANCALKDTTALACLTCDANFEEAGGLCVACPAGHTSVAGGLCTYDHSALEQYCPPGYFYDNDDVFACVACASGSWSAAGTSGTDSAAACTLCDANCVACDRATGQCHACVIGWAPNPANRALCADCAGVLSDGTACMPGITDYTHCGPGHECLDPPACLNCAPCAPGTWSDGHEDNCTACSVTCDGCDPNTGYCTACDSGYTFLGTACVLCDDAHPCIPGAQPCAPGEELVAGVCTLCDPGTYSDGTACTACPAGTFSAASAAVCTPCPPGSFSNATGTATACTACSTLGALYVSDGTGTGCVLCPADSPPNSARTACHYDDSALTSRLDDLEGEVACAAGTEWTGAACTPCATGAAGAGGASACTPCPPGTVPSANVCVPCAEGTYSAATTDAACGACTGTANCLHCDPTSGVCLHCEHEYYLVAGACTPCPENEACDGTATTAPCPAGSYSPAGYSQCLYNETALAARVTANEGDIAAIESAFLVIDSCPAGSYEAATSGAPYAIKQCAPCGEGEYSLGSPAVGCTACASLVAGCEQCDVADGACTRCAGGYQLAPGAPGTCTACTGAFACDGGVAATNCTAAGALATSDHLHCVYDETALAARVTVLEAHGHACPPGTYLDTDTDACTPCPAGYFSALAGAVGVNGSVACGTCSAGCTPTDAFGLCDRVTGECLRCAAGFYVDATGACMACADDTYTLGGAIGACTACPTRCTGAAGACDAATGECTACAPGYGGTTCAPCADGTFSVGGSLAPCAVGLPDGYTCSAHRDCYSGYCGGSYLYASTPWFASPSIVGAIGSPSNSGRVCLSEQYEITQVVTRGTDTPANLENAVAPDALDYCAGTYLNQTAVSGVWRYTDGVPLLSRTAAGAAPLDFDDLWARVQKLGGPGTAAIYSVSGTRLTVGAASVVFQATNASSAAWLLSSAGPSGYSDYVYRYDVAAGTSITDPAAWGWPVPAAAPGPYDYTLVTGAAYNPSATPSGDTCTDWTAVGAPDAARGGRIARDFPHATYGWIQEASTEWLYDYNTLVPCNTPSPRHYCLYLSSLVPDCSAIAPAFDANCGPTQRCVPTADFLAWECI
jgi:hypothetical protein